MVKSVIDVVSVSKTYYDPVVQKEIRTLDDVSVSARENDFLILLGPSGCGKSTLLNIIAGLVPCDRGSGSVLVHGVPVTAPNPKMMAYMFQDPVLYPWRTVLKNVEFGLEAQGIDKAERRRRAQKYLRLAGMEGFEHYYPRQLSGGMSQRVAMCRSLALETDIILMDEPFGALDEQSRIILGDELVSIWRQVGRTIVFVTHSLTEAVYLGERICVFTSRPGRIKLEIDNTLPRPRTIGDPAFNAMVQTLWTHLREESLASLAREKIVAEPAALPEE
jgi:NitT/TauT family transport system ATP-binding protein